MSRFDPFTYRRDLGSYTVGVLQQAIPGIVLGVALDRILKKIQDVNNIEPWIMIIVQILLSIVILFIIEKYISQRYAEAWQNTTPGFFFVAFYFSCQIQLFTNINTVASHFA